MAISCKLVYEWRYTTIYRQLQYKQVYVEKDNQQAVKI